MVSGRRSGHPVRALKSPFARAYAEMEKNPDVSDGQLDEYGAGALRRAVVDGDTEKGSFLCGQVAGLVKREQTCKEIIEEIVAEAATVIKNAATRLK